MVVVPKDITFTKEQEDRIKELIQSLVEDISYPLPINKGGTGEETQTAAFDALAPTTTQGDMIYHNGSDNTRVAKGTAGQVLKMNSGATAPEFGDVGSKLTTVYTDVTVANTTTETDLISYLVPANTLGTNNAIRIRVIISSIKNAGPGAGTITFRVKFGNGTLLTSTAFDLDATDMEGTLDILIVQTGAVDSQETSLLTSLRVPVTNKNPAIAPIGIQKLNLDSTGRDGTTAQTLKLTAQWSSASASNTLTMSHAIVEVIKNN